MAEAHVLDHADQHGEVGCEAGSSSLATSSRMIKRFG